MLNNKNFYPTPQPLIIKMISKVTGNPQRILEPSAGKGDIIKLMRKRYNTNYSAKDFYAIEIDPVLQSTLRGENIKLLDSDFLLYSGPDQFDLIIANPPFDNAERHLFKAIDIMYRGEIVFLLNAETFRNPYSQLRKDLIRKLLDLNADLEYHQGEFIEAERKTNVEVALVYIKIERKIEDDLFGDATNRVHGSPILEEQVEEQEISTKKNIEELVLEYQRAIKINTETIMEFCRTREFTRSYLTLSFGKGDDSERCSDLTAVAQQQINGVITLIRIHYWRKVLELKEVKNRMTSKKRNEFESQINIQCDMEFTENNIRQFVLNLIGSYEDILTEAVLDMFDKMTVKHRWDESIHCKNVHYFNGWKTNNAFKVNKRIIIPMYGGMGGGPFTSWLNGKWDLDYKVKGELNDIDLVMNYFDGRNDYTSLVWAIEHAFNLGNNKGESSYFKFICYKKGTIHLTFTDEDIRRRFNVVACQGKKWLPGDYGTTPFDQLSIEHQAIVKQFEEKVEDYKAAEGKPLFAAKEALQIAM